MLVSQIHQATNYMTVRSDSFKNKKVIYLFCYIYAADVNLQLTESHIEPIVIKHLRNT